MLESLSDVPDTFFENKPHNIFIIPYCLKQPSTPFKIHYKTTSTCFCMIWCLGLPKSGRIIWPLAPSGVCSLYKDGCVFRVHK